MVYEGVEYNTIGGVFDKAVEVAKEGLAYKCRAFMDSYVSHIIAANEERGERLTVQEAKDIARSNFSYFSGYYNNETARLIHESYFKEQ